MSRNDVGRATGSAHITSAYPFDPLSFRRPALIIRHSPAGQMRDFELHSWFSAEELETCTACGKRSAIDIHELDTSLCLECGHVENSPARPVSRPDGAQGRSGSPAHGTNRIRDTHGAGAEYA